jgi:hypothetical protein
VDARVQQARRDAREEAAREIDCAMRELFGDADEYKQGWNAGLEAGAAAIRALSDTPPGMVLDQLAQQDLRASDCIKQWPECESGAYDPRCCRFPKSCSCESGALKGEGDD